MTIERNEKIADCLLLALKRGFKHIGQDAIADNLTLFQEAEHFDICDDDTSFAVRVSDAGIGIQIFTIGRTRNIHVEHTIEVDADEAAEIDGVAAIITDNVPTCIYDATAWLLGEWVKFGIEEMGWELLFCGSNQCRY